MKTAFAGLFVASALALVILTQSVYTIDQREQAIVLQLGQPVGLIREPGLHFKIPVVQDVRYFSRQILSVDPPPAQVVISSDRDSAAIAGDAMASGEPIIVDTFVRYRIADPLRFMKTLGSEDNAEHRLESIVNDATRTALGKITLSTLLSAGRNAVMQDIRAAVDKKIDADHLGVAIVDIRIVRADLTPELRSATVRRMISELKERATKTRAEGEEKALEIRATADKERTVILAEAGRDSAIARGEGDKTAIKIYGDAFNKDKDFYAFMRTLDAYRATLAGPDTKLVLSPDNAFLKFFKNGP